MSTATLETPVDGVDIPADQRWFWTDEWQDGEREADRDIAAGRTEFDGSTAELLAHLDALTEPETEQHVGQVGVLAISASPDRYELLVDAAIDAHAEGLPAVGHVFFAMAADMAYRLREAGVAGWGVRLDEVDVEGVAA